MSPIPSTPRGMVFEEFQPGQRILSSGRTIAESDILTFAGLSGDHNPMHTDAEFSRRGQFGQRVAHGLLGLAIASGLAMQTGVLEDTVIAFREVASWKFSLPVFIGDTLHVEMIVRETKEMRRLGGGMVTIDVNVLNQQDAVVMKGAWIVLVRSRANLPA